MEAVKNKVTKVIYSSGKPTNIYISVGCEEKSKVFQLIWDEIFAHMDEFQGQMNFDTPDLEREDMLSSDGYLDISITEDFEEEIKCSFVKALITKVFELLKVKPCWCNFNFCAARNPREYRDPDFEPIEFSITHV